MTEPKETNETPAAATNEISDQELEKVAGGGLGDVILVTEGMFGSGGFVQTMVEKAKAAIKGKT